MRAAVFSPAKINLLLAVTGRRADGFHDLLSVAAPVEFGDDLVAEVVKPGGSGAPVCSLACDVAAVPVDGSNLILRAAQAYAAATGWSQAVHFRLTKRIPMGAGLGGGSSNAVAALRALEQLSGGAAGPARLAELAAGLGSDCALFLANAPVVMRGRGERVELLPPGAAARMCGRRVLVFKPDFGISTPWAYGRMVARGEDYLPAEAAEARWVAWLAGAAPLEELLFNNMEPAAFGKFIALPVLLEQLRGIGLAPRMSGSGSACYALLGDEQVTTEAEALIRRAWGPAAFVQVTRLVGDRVPH